MRTRQVHKRCDKAPLGVGDLVEYIEENYNSLRAGMHYVVSAIRFSDIDQKPIGVYLEGQPSGDWWNFHRFRLVRAARTCRTCSQPLPLPPIVIKGNPVVFSKGKIAVGCTTVRNAQVRAIAERLED